MSEVTGESHGVKGWFNKLRSRSTTPVPEPSSESFEQKYDRIKAETQNVTATPTPQERANVLLAHADIKRKQQEDLQKLRTMTTLAPSPAPIAEVANIAPVPEAVSATSDPRLREFDAFSETSSGVSDGKGGFLSKEQLAAQQGQLPAEPKNTGLRGKLGFLSRQRFTAPPLTIPKADLSRAPEVRPLQNQIDTTPKGPKLGRFFSRL